MSHFVNKLGQANTTSNLLGAALSDGATAGLLGGIFGSILPIIGLFTRNSSAVSLGFLVNIFLYFVTGIFAGYLYYSRKIGNGWLAPVVGLIGGFLAGTISGAATGFALSQASQVLNQLTSNIGWVMWSILSGLGAGFIALLAAWIPGFFIHPENTTGYRRQTSAISTKGTKQHETMGEFFERRRKRRFVIGMVSIILMFAIYFCQIVSR